MACDGLSATVEVKAPYRDGTLTWQFPIRGVVNAPPHLHALAFSCSCCQHGFGSTAATPITSSCS